MKKAVLLLALMLLALLALCACALADTSISPGPDDLSKDQAVETATERFLEACAYSEKDLASFTVKADLWDAFTSQNGAMPRRWQVIFASRENAGLAFVVLVASPSGEIISAEPSDFPAQLMAYRQEAAEKAIAVEQGKIWIAEKGPWELWSYQDKAAFQTAYGRHPNGVKTGLPIGLPGDGDVGLDKAVESAKKAIMEHFGVTAHRLDGLMLDCAFYTDWALSNGLAGRVWVIAFRDPNSRADGMYRMLYQANVLSKSGDTDRIVQVGEGQDGNGEPDTIAWPPYPDVSAMPELPAEDIYWNPRGGKYYHTDANCPSVAQEYLPLTKIDKSKMGEQRYCYLRPCTACTGASHSGQ